jgi:transcriptional regulator with XRE-family HTH domain
LPRRGKADPTAQAFGAAVRALRQERSETLEDVARRLARMDAKYLGEIERGWHAPSITTAKRIADALDVPLARLVADM